jgi:hypothetical protein
MIDTDFINERISKCGGWITVTVWEQYGEMFGVEQGL